MADSFILLLPSQHFLLYTIAFQQSTPVVNISYSTVSLHTFRTKIEFSGQILFRERRSFSMETGNGSPAPAKVTTEDFKEIYTNCFVNLTTRTRQTVVY